MTGITKNLLFNLPKAEKLQSPSIHVEKRFFLCSNLIRGAFPTHTIS